MVEIPNNIKKAIGDRAYEIDTVGMSNSQVLCFEDMVLKIEKQGEESGHECQMMAWLNDKLPVPKILCRAKENDMNYLLMTKIGGEMLCATEILENPKLLVKLLAEGLRMLWHVDISECPYNNSIDNKLKNAEIRVQSNLCNIEDAEPETYGENGFDSPSQLLQWLKDNKPVEELVFSHGDYCLPNVFTKGKRISGFIDLGQSGVADKYQDIALCYRSLQHNYSGVYGGKVYEEFDARILFDELNIVPDWDKIKYYILLDELF